MWVSCVLGTGDTAGKKRDKAYPPEAYLLGGRMNQSKLKKKTDKMIQTGLSAMKEIEIE